MEATRKPVPNKTPQPEQKVCLIRENPRKSVAKIFPAKTVPAKTNAARASHPSRIVSWISRLAFPPLGAAGRRYQSDSAPKECHFYRYRPQSAILRITALQPLRRPAAQPAPGAGCRGGRNARATGTRSRAFPISPGNSPSRIAGCHQRHRNHHSASFKSRHVFAEPTLRHNVAPRNRKTFPPCAETVDDSTSLWKAEEKRAGIAAAKMWPQDFSIT